jgi:hypothetical protein
MADLVRSISLTVPDAFVARLTAWVNSQPGAEPLGPKFDRIAGALLRAKIKEELRNYEAGLAAAGVTDIEVT